MQFSLRTRISLGVLAASVVAGGIIAFGTGNPAQDVRLLSGAAWLASGKVGQLTLLDGSTAEVAGQVQVASAGNDLEVVQQGMTAYAVNKTSGTIRRVDGATFEASPPANPIPEVTGGLTAFAGPTALYALDTQHGIVTEADPRTAERVGDPQPMSAQLSAGTAVVDDAGRLWIIDTATGDLTRVAGGRRTRESVTGPGASVLTLVNGAPVVVNTARREAVTIDTNSGTANRTLTLDLRPDDKVRVGGSPHNSKLYLVASRGIVNICDLASENCDRAIPLAGGDFGGPIEAGSRLFVPDFGSGQVWIIDLGSFQVIAKPQVLSSPGQFQLLNRDGVVFFNEPASARAGVIQLDGTVNRATKYNEGDPNQGVKAGQLTTGKATPTRPATSSTGATQPPLPGDPASVTVAVRVSKATPMVGEQVTFSVDSEATEPAKVRWDFADGATLEGLPVQHKWAAPGTYMVTAQVEMPDRRRGTASLSVTVSLTPKHRLTVTTNDGGTVTSADQKINCGAKSTCVFDYDEGAHVILTPHPAAEFAFSQWGEGDCHTQPCELTMTGAKKAQALFKPTVAKLTVQIAAAGGSVKLNNQACNACTLSFTPGQNVPVAATPDTEHDFDSWDVRTCADTHAANCTTQADTTRTIVVRFKPKPKATLTLKFDGNGSYESRVQITSERGPAKTCLSGDTYTCVTEWVAGDRLTLTADEISGQGGRFWYWEPRSCGDTRTCQTTMDASKSMTAWYSKVN